MSNAENPGKKNKINFTSKRFWSIIISVIIFLAIFWLFQLAGSDAENNETTPTSDITGTDAIKKLEGLQIKDSINLFKEKSPITDPTLYVNILNNTLVYVDPLGHNTIMELDNSNSIQKIKPESQNDFDNLINDSFHLSNYEDLLNKNTDLSTNDIEDATKSIGADLKNVVAGKNDIRTILTSLIYNTVINSNCVTVIGYNNKMESINKNDYTFDIINTSRLPNAIENW